MFESEPVARKPLAWRIIFRRARSRTRTLSPWFYIVETREREPDFQVTSVRELDSLVQDF